MSEYPAEYLAGRNPLYSMTLKQICKQAIKDWKEDSARRQAHKNSK